MKKDVTYEVPAVARLVRKLACTAGASEADAARFADVLVSADVHGTATHGVSRLGIYLRRIEAGLIDPRAHLRVERERSASLALDAANGLGQVQALKALDLLVPRARTHGVAVATVRRSQHFGALSYYCNRAAAENLVLIATTNCEPAMSPSGACEAFFGTNPIGVSFPSGLGFPIKIDLATSIVARGNIIAAQRDGRPIPAGWALDPAGEPTTDASQALLGTVLTMAGHKGYALALMVEMLSGVMSGAAVGPRVGSMYKQLDRPQDVGHCFILLDIDAFVPVAEFKQRVDDTIRGIKACRRCPGVEEVLVPGERSHRIAESRRANGIPLAPATCRDLEEWCERLDVPFELTRAAARSTS